jgi:esterase/lipase superfamily enzyme
MRFPVTLILGTEISIIFATFFRISSPMQRAYHRWNSPSLRRDMELLVFGHGGIPVIVFPTSKGRFFDFENRGMVAAIGDGVDRGAYQLYCVDSVDDESWYNENAQPRERVLRHLQYEQYILNEAIPFVRGNNQSEKLFVTGCSFGGYHSVNFALRHPDRVDSCISMGGAFDIRPFVLMDTMMRNAISTILWIFSLT